MIYSLVADVIAFLHAVFAALIFYPLLCLACGKEVPLWVAASSVIGASASIISYIFLHDCFINPVQKYFKRKAGKEVFQGSFVAHYLYVITGIRINRHLLFWLIIVCGATGGISVIQYLLK